MTDVDVDSKEEWHLRK